MRKNLFRVITFLISLYAVTSDQHEIDLYVFIHILIIGINTYSLFSYEKNPYSLHKVFHVFTLFFFGVAPVLQYYGNIRFLGEPSIPNEVKITVSFIILISTGLFNLIYMLSFKYSNLSGVKSKIQKMTVLNFNKVKFSGSTNLLFIGLSLLSLITMLYINDFNFVKLFFRGGDIVGNPINENTGNKTILLIANQFVRPICFISFIISATYNKENKTLNLFLFLIFFITCSPTSLARNATAAYYIPLLLLFIPIFQKKHVFTSAMIGGIMVIFPFLNNFRRFNLDTKLTLGLNYEMFTHFHFDAYMTFCRVVNLDLVTYGNQLLGVLFFFIPRSIWLDKPQSSGYFHAEVLNFKFKNIACTFLAEGYINFGYVGVFLFLFFIAWFSGRLDKIFWTYIKHKSYYNILYILFLGMFLFILRGDLMNGYSYTLGLLLSALFVYYLVVKKNSFKL